MYEAWVATELSTEPASYAMGYQDIERLSVTFTGTDAIVDATVLLYWPKRQVYLNDGLPLPAVPDPITKTVAITIDGDALLLRRGATYNLEVHWQLTNGREITRVLKLEAS